ncbi:hypothetical protein Syun_006862 [Stephania yunnanensis]|uniref:C2H2-type domain-containing protein n=1 Tax=Stephania yunnanensis TaxID=152371 RepID=A0AAP0KXK7_9MAGN
MEFTQHEEDSKTSSDESDKQDAVNDEVRIGRSYECVFCKRGFTTAQALGGHMNIHRRDRARNKQPASGSGMNHQPVEEYMRPGFLHAISSQSSFYSPPMMAHKNHNMHANRPVCGVSPHQHRYYFADRETLSQKPPPFRLFEDNWRSSLSLQIGSTYMDERQDANKPANKEDELDLELRLGHDP